MEHSRNTNTTGKGGKAKGLAPCTTETFKTWSCLSTLSRALRPKAEGAASVLGRELWVFFRDTEVLEGPAGSLASWENTALCLYKGDPGGKKR